VVEDVPHHRARDPLGEAEDVVHAEAAVVVLDHQPGARGVGELREAGLEAVHRRPRAARGAPDVEDDHRLGRQSHRVEELGLELEVADGARAHGGILGVQHDVLPRVRGEPQSEPGRDPTELRELLGAVLHLSMEPGQVGVGRVGRERRGHPVHRDVRIREVGEDRPQALE